MTTTTTTDDPAAPPSLRQRAALVRDYLRRLGPAAPLVVCCATLPPLGSAALIAVAAKTSLAATLTQLGGLGILAYATSFWLLGLFLLPTYAYSVLGGYCFGFWGGMAGAVTGYMGAATGAFLIARRLGRDRVAGIVREHPKLSAVHDALLAASPPRTVGLIALVRVSPAAPFALTNVALGASPGVTLPQYVLGSLVGVIPRSAVVVGAAASMSTLDFTAASGKWLLAAGIAATILTLSVFTAIARRALERATRMASPDDASAPIRLSG